MEPDVPPDFFRVIDAAGLDQEFAEILVFRERLEGVWNSGARKALEHFETITFQPRVLADPERGVDRESVDVRQEIARLVHDVDGRFAGRYADVHMQAEDQIRPRQALHVFHDLLVALSFGDELVVPVGKGVRADGSDPQIRLAGERRELAAQFDNVLTRVRDRRTNLRAQLDDRLVHLRLDLFL